MATISSVKPGCKILHKASGEIAIVTAVSDVVATAWISRGFGPSIEIELCDALHEIIDDCDCEDGGGDECGLSSLDNEAVDVIAEMIADDLLSEHPSEEHGVRLNLVMSSGRLGGYHRKWDLVAAIKRNIEEYFSDEI